MMLTKTSPHPSFHAFFASRLTCLPECFIACHPDPCHCQARVARLSRPTPSGYLRQSDSFRRKDWVGNLLRIRKFKDVGNRSLERQFPGGAWESKGMSNDAIGSAEMPGGFLVDPVTQTHGSLFPTLLQACGADVVVDGAGGP